VPSGSEGDIRRVRCENCAPISEGGVCGTLVLVLILMLMLVLMGDEAVEGKRLLNDDEVTLVENSLSPPRPSGGPVAVAIPLKDGPIRSELKRAAGVQTRWEWRQSVRLELEVGQLKEVEERTNLCEYHSKRWVWSV
jgi:hypothetical protein